LTDRSGLGVGICTGLANRLWAELLKARARPLNQIPVVTAKSVNAQRASHRRHLKIVHVTCVHPVRDPRIFEKECRSLAEDGHEVVLVAPHTQDEMLDGVRIRAIPPASSRRLRLATAGWRAFATALSERADLYHLHDPELLLPFQFARLLGKKFVFDMHEDLPKAVLAKEWISPSMRRLIAAIVRPLERLMLTGVPVVFAEISYAADYPWAQPTSTIFNYPTLELLDSSRSTRRPGSIGYLGAIRPERGLTVTLHALRELKMAGRSLSFDLIGAVDSRNLDLIKDYIRVNELDVRLHGYLPLAKAWPLISGCQIGLALLQPMPNYVESYPTKIFDYMGLGVPVLCSDFPLYRHLVEEVGCGRCVDPTRPDLIAEAVTTMLDNPEELELMGQRGIEAVRRRFNWTSQARHLKRFYDQIVPT
jgi:glycosyltransferase involved in cell wall biosynthesis